jgi:hypothetical protein
MPGRFISIKKITPGYTPGASEKYTLPERRLSLLPQNYRARMNYQVAIIRKLYQSVAGFQSVLKKSFPDFFSINCGLGYEEKNCRYRRYQA